MSIFNLGNAAQGKIPIAGSPYPEWAYITSNQGTLVITNGTNSINIEIAEDALKYEFLVVQPGGQNAANVTGNNTSYLLGAAVALTKIMDIGSNVFVGDGANQPATFTAPMDGKYFLQISVLSQFDTNSAHMDRSQYEIATSNMTYIGCVVDPYNSGIRDSDNNLSTLGLSFSVIAQLDMGDSVTFGIRQNQSSDPKKVVQVNGSDNAQTAISGYLI